MSKGEMKHACSNPHCTTGGFIPLHQLACKACWFALPEPLRAAINATWRARDRAAHSENVLQARELWADAAKAAQGPKL